MDRQIHTPVAQRQSVIALPDVLNISSLFAVPAFVILTPLVSGSHFFLPVQCWEARMCCCVFTL